MTDKSQQRERFEIAEIDALFDHASECFHNGIPLDPTKQALLLDMAIYLKSLSQPAVAGAVDEWVIECWKTPRYGAFDEDGKFVMMPDDEHHPLEDEARWVGGVHDYQLAAEVARSFRTATPSQPAAQCKVWHDGIDPTDTDPHSQQCLAPARASPADDGEMIRQQLPDMELALMLIADSYLPDQPAADSSSRYEYAVNHIRRLRRYARQALPSHIKDGDTNGTSI